MKGVKITPFRSYFNSRLGVEKNSFSGGKNYPKFGVKLGVKVTLKKGVLYLKCLLHFWSYNNSLKIIYLPKISYLNSEIFIA